MPGPRTLRYGGNTACVELRSDSGTLVVLDIGTGAFALGQELMAAGHPIKGHVLISHTHWDHIQGLPFFAPFFVPGNEWDIYAPRGLGPSLRDTLAGQMQYTYFPITLEQFGATLRYHELVEGSFTVGDIQVEAQYLNHPALTLGYRLTADGVTTVYACDHEPYSAALATGTGDLEGQDRRHAEFLAEADLVIHDAQYTATEYAKRVGWGHSTMEYALHMVRVAGAKRLALTHHDPLRDDDALDELVARFRATHADGGLPIEVFAAAEGQVLELSAREVPARREVGSSAKIAVAPALSGQSVLLAMSDTGKAAELARVLQDDGVRVLTSDTAHAVAATERERPSLLVLEDNGNPEQIAETCRAVRQLDHYGRDLPIILQTRNDSSRACKELGITDRLVKPYSSSYARTRFRAWLMRTACRWARAPVPKDEDRRLATLNRLALLDSPQEERFDHLTRLAARAFDAPIALITLVDRDRQWFKSRLGVETAESPRDESFCAHAVFDRLPLIVPDTLLDPRFADNPAVTGSLRVRFYAGYPLVVSDGSCIGTLCVADTRPREPESTALDQLRSLAEMAIREADRPHTVTAE